MLGSHTGVLQYNSLLVTYVNNSTDQGTLELYCKYIHTLKGMHIHIYFINAVCEAILDCTYNYRDSFDTDGLPNSLLHCGTWSGKKALITYVAVDIYHMKRYTPDRQTCACIDQAVPHKLANRHACKPSS